MKRTLPATTEKQRRKPTIWY